MFSAIGHKVVAGIGEIGLGAVLLGQSLFWIVMGRSRAQPVRLAATFGRCMEVGIEAIPIVTMMSVTIGIMLAVQGIYALKVFGAEDQVTVGLGLSVVREFGPLITGILVSGRTGSSLAARIGTMRISQEIDALQVMGIEPVRFIVAPALIAMVIMVPLLAFWADMVMLAGAGWYVSHGTGHQLSALMSSRSVGNRRRRRRHARPFQEHAVRNPDHPGRRHQRRQCGRRRRRCR